MESDGQSQQIDGEQTDRAIVKQDEDKKKDVTHSEAEDVQTSVSDLIIHMYIIQFTPIHILLASLNNLTCPASPSSRYEISFDYSCCHSVDQK